MSLDLWTKMAPGQLCSGNPDLGGASHLQLLLACVAASEGGVLELGIGHSSTPVLHSVCCGAKWSLMSLETDLDWLDGFSAWACDGHTLAPLTPKSLTAACTRRWGVVFVDDSPGGENRAEHVRRFLPIADYVVVHDMQEDGNNFAPVMAAAAQCPHQLVYKRYHPWTAAFSNFLPIPHVP